MIPSDWRFWSPSGALFPGGPYTWHIIDWDQRRWISVTGSEEALPDDEDAINILSKHIEHLDSDVFEIKVSDDGELFSTSSKLKDDATWAIHYPRYDVSSTPSMEKNTLTRSLLEEVDRLGPEVDLVRYTDESGISKLVVFKYAMIEQHLRRMWKELHIIKNLPQHPFIVPFHRIVLDDIEPRILGFTISYVPGGTFADNQTRPFRFKWLQQLTSVVDDLNLKFNITHQDISPRNLLVDPVTENIQLFDFDRAAKIGSQGEDRRRNDVDGVIFTIYEILTLDDHFRTIPFDQQDVKNVEEIETWDVKAPVEEGTEGVEAFRKFLREWAQGRRTKPLKLFSEASSPLDWPDYPPDTPIRYVSYPDSDNEDGAEPITFPGGARTRTDARRNGQHVVCWERPPSTSKFEIETARNGKRAFNNVDISNDREKRSKAS
ncbi:hypothetical protein LARI1_G008264 [Lachnellula arida]|uniref:EKC/KEOPS complex subunit BUD32 n=1 Tax=Lachnellula arida TaxID=1316785 RepID=A0A8T9B0T9_9HELO|nr:hypothetical protein LARI1_G008264 [Lachnellula arida]